MPIPGRLVPWWDFVQDSASKYGLDPLVVLGVLDRESLGGVLLEPSGPTGTGDGGHGLGLMQIDRRYHWAWASTVLEDGTPIWQQPAENIDKGASILADNVTWFENWRMAMPDVLAGAVTISSIAGYNAARARVLEKLEALTQPASYEAKLQACDSCTTQGNYVTDVLGRRERFRSAALTPSQPPPPKPKGVT